MNGKITRSQGVELLNAAKVMDGEAATWADGFARWDGKELLWDSHSDFAHVRYVKLVNYAEKLRAIARQVFSEPEYFL